MIDREKIVLSNVGDVFCSHGFIQFYTTDKTGKAKELFEEYYAADANAPASEKEEDVNGDTSPTNDNSGNDDLLS